MVTAQQIIAQLSHPTEADTRLIKKAYSTAEEAHQKHTRYSGEPYLTHVAEVAFRLASIGMGPRTVAAGLLHDTIEDTELTSEDISEAFGEEILFLVEGVTKLSSVRYYGADRHNESLRKLFVATSQDIRVLIIKLVDRLHNMHTLEYVPEEKQVRIARETLEIYVPVAHRLGIGSIRKELEDLAFPYVYPNEYQRVVETVKDVKDKADKILERERKGLQKDLTEAGMLDFKTSYRVKGMYSLYHKLKRKEWNVERIYDLLALRVIVPDVEDCYRALGIVHKLWRPLPGRMKDYIAFPKPNGYQSIHTTVTTPAGNILEIQIRTEAMHHEAEFGVASHLTYKAKNADLGGGSWFSKMAPSLFRPFTWRQQRQSVSVFSKEVPDREKIPQWISQIGEMYSTEKSTGQEFLEDMRADFFHDRIFVFTPNGDVVDLPKGASPIDFAYAIHSDIGNSMSGAKVNQKLVSLESELHNGDIVEIERRKNAKPTTKWLDFAKTSLAKRRIKGALAEDNV